MNFDFNKTEARMREICQSLKGDNVENREALEAEFANLKREYEMETAMAKAQREQPKQGFNFMKALRESGREGLNLRTAITAAGLAGKAIETELQSILEPLYANSILARLGVKWYKGMPMGDISIPVMGKGSVAWAEETGDSTDGTQTFSNNIVLKPYRLTAHFDITEQMLLQDTIGVEDAIKRDAIKALTDKLEATILGTGSGLKEDGETRISPAGIFYNQTLSDATSFAKLCGIEAGVEEANVTGEMKYLLSCKAKADLRSMAKSSKNTQLVMEGGAIDGTPAVVTSNVAQTNKAPYVYGNFDNLAVASWSDLIFKKDESVAYGNGKIRIYVTGYFDAKVLRSAAFAFGDTRWVAPAQNSSSSSNAGAEA